MSWFITLILAGSLITTGNTLPGSDNNIYENQGVPVFSQHDETERFEKTYPFSPNGQIEVSNINGSITIEAWDNPQIYLEAIKYADVKERLSEVSVDIDASQNNFKVEADYDQWGKSNRGHKNNRGNYGTLKVDFRLKVPRTAILNEIQAVNGSVTVSDMTKYTEISAVNGRVKATNLRGTAKLSTVNGSVLADFDRLESKSVVSLGTVNGSVKLVIPSDINAVIRADTLNGSINNSFGLPVKKGEYVGRDLYGRVGSNKVRIEDYSKIKLSSVNGGLSIERKDDGKTMNPATNLLPEKTSDDFDSDFNSSMRDAEREIRADMAEVRKDLAEARREVIERKRVSRVTNREVSKEVSKEINKIKPKIAEINPEEIEIAVNTKAMEAAIEAIESLEALEKVEPQELREMILTKRVESQLNIPSVEQENGSFATKGIPRITLNVENSSISVRGWDRPEVKYSVTKISKDQISKAQNKKAVTVTTEQNDSDDVSIEVINESDGEGKFRFGDPTQVQLEVFVPKKSNLRIVTNDELRIEGVSGELNLRAEDEAVNLRDIKGKLFLRVEDGIARLIGFSGELESEIVDGEMFLEGDFQKINARVGDGTIVLTLPDDANANISANTESVKGEGIELICNGNDSEKSDKSWTIGKGGKNFNFEVGDGKVVIRSLSEISAGL